MKGNQVLPQNQLLADSSFQKLALFLIKQTGLTYYREKEAEMAVRISKRMAAYEEIDCEEYLQLLQGTSGTGELERLISDLTIGETFFFRHNEQLEVLRKAALPEILEQNRIERKLRIWSAGCSIGAEPYTLAILLEQVLGAERDSWDISLVATDINQRFLDSARKGRFSSWALRSSSPEFLQQYFHKDGNEWVIKERFARAVRFSYHNLVHDPFPPLELSPSVGCDLIVCRNVMIYFDRDTIASLADSFHQALRPGGWLLVGPSENDREIFTGFQVVAEPAATIFRRTDSPSERIEWAEPCRLPVIVETVRPSCEKVQCSSSKPDKLLQLVDESAWEALLEYCDQELETDPLTAIVHYFRALALLRVNRFLEAEQAFRRVIYLDRFAAPAHYELGLILRKRREHKAAEKSFRNALRAWSNHNPNQFPSALSLEQIQAEMAREFEGLRS